MRAAERGERASAAPVEPIGLNDYDEFALDPPCDATTGWASGWPAGRPASILTMRAVPRRRPWPGGWRTCRWPPSIAARWSGPWRRPNPWPKPTAWRCSVREELGETRYGEWTGRALKELQKEELWPVVQVYPGGARFPGGESMREVQARMVAELDAIRDRTPGQTVAVVSHSDPIKMAVAHYAGLPLDLFQRLTISPASVTAFAFTRFGPRLVCLNHTEALPSFKSKRRRQGAVTMPYEVFDLNPVDRITTDAIGEPGKRVFYLQARKGTQLVTVICEKEHVAALAMAIEQTPAVPGR